jgi:cation transport protein ChaC
MAADFLWVFGYGSLVWRPGFHFTQAHDGYVLGFTRRFWQGSPDHRGTLTSPGRVVTLLPCCNLQQEEKVWGRVYGIPALHANEALAHLTQREIAGYSELLVDVHIVVETGYYSIQPAMVYLATETNEHFLGGNSCTNSSIAKQIWTSHGPSGANVEYFDQLYAALELMSERVNDDCLDSHLRDIHEELERWRKQVG